MDFFCQGTYNKIIMTDLQTIFYVMGIIYMLLGIVLLIAVGVGIIFVFRAVRDIRTKVEEKIKYVDRIIKHPEDVAAEIGAALIRKGVNKMKQVISVRKTS